jgi:hypothetical protein
MKKYTGQNKRGDYLSYSFSIIRVFVLVISISALAFSAYQKHWNHPKSPTIPEAYLTEIQNKKGISGGVTPDLIDYFNISWFYNWAHYPVYKNSDLNWDQKVWQKFVPLFYGISYSSASIRIKEICTKRPEYCNGGYYLIGNEPDNSLEDGKNSKSLDEMVSNSVIRYGNIINSIKEHDPKAKFIILGLTSLNKEFTQLFITKWKDHWKSDPNLAILPDLIKGWHVHTYSNYYECPANDAPIKTYLDSINQKMIQVFGKTINDQELWVSEMGSLSNIPNPNSSDPQEKANWNKFKKRMECLVKTYENSPLVTRYAWFYFGCNKSIHSFCSIPYASYNLSFPQGNSQSVSELGQLYAILNSSFPSSSPKPTPKATASPISHPTIAPSSTPFSNPPVLSSDLKCESRCSFGKYQCERDSNNAGFKGGKCQFNQKCPGSGTDWRWSYCYDSNSINSNVSNSSNTTLPESNLNCESKCSFGKSQCERDSNNANFKGGSCQFNQKCPGTGTDWRWSYCYN